MSLRIGYNQGIGFYRVATLQIISTLTKPEDWKGFLNKDSSFLQQATFEYNPDNFLYFRARAISGGEKHGPNGNGDYFPWNELLASYKTFVGKGFYLDHKSDNIENAKGIILDAIPVMDEEYIECMVAIDRQLAPEVCRQIESGILNAVSMGCLAQSAECCICHNVAHNEAQLCEHMRPGTSSYTKGRDYTGQIKADMKLWQEKTAYEKNMQIIFTELSGVTTGADKGAHIFEIIASELKEKVEALLNHFKRYQSVKGSTSINKDNINEAKLKLLAEMLEVFSEKQKDASSDELIKAIGELKEDVAKKLGTIDSQITGIIEAKFNEILADGEGSIIKEASYGDVYIKQDMRDGKTDEQIVEKIMDRYNDISKEEAEQIVKNIHEKGHGYWNEIQKSKASLNRKAGWDIGTEVKTVDGPGVVTKVKDMGLGDFYYTVKLNKNGEEHDYYPDAGEIWRIALLNKEAKGKKEKMADWNFRKHTLNELEELMQAIEDDRIEDAKEYLTDATTKENWDELDWDNMVLELRHELAYRKASLNREAISEYEIRKKEKEDRAKHVKKLKKEMPRLRSLLEKIINKVIKGEETERLEKKEPETGTGTEIALGDGYVLKQMKDMPISIAELYDREQPTGVYVALLAESELSEAEKVLHYRKRLMLDVPQVPVVQSEQEEGAGRIASEIKDATVSIFYQGYGSNLQEALEEELGKPVSQEELKMAKEVIKKLKKASLNSNEEEGMERESKYDNEFSNTVIKEMVDAVYDEAKSEKKTEYTEKELKQLVKEALAFGTGEAGVVTPEQYPETYSEVYNRVKKKLLKKASLNSNEEEQAMRFEIRYEDAETGSLKDNYFVATEGEEVKRVKATYLIPLDVQRKLEAGKIEDVISVEEAIEQIKVECKGSLEGFRSFVKAAKREAFSRAAKEIIKSVNPDEEPAPPKKQFGKVTKSVNEAEEAAGKKDIPGTSGGSAGKRVKDFYNRLPNSSSDGDNITKAINPQSALIKENERIASDLKKAQDELTALKQKETVRASSETIAMVLNDLTQKLGVQVSGDRNKVLVNALAQMDQDSLVKVKAFIGLLGENEVNEIEIEQENGNLPQITANQENSANVEMVENLRNGLVEKERAKYVKK